MAGTFAEKKRKLEEAQREYDEALGTHLEELIAQRADIDRQLAELNAATGPKPQSFGKRRTGN